jgi:allantoate deiminase
MTSSLSNTSPLSAARIVERLQALAVHTSVPGEMTRLTLSPAHKAAADQVAAWFSLAGLETYTDALGTVVGRFASNNPHAKTLLIGSHIDTVPNGGIYDGNLGVLAGLAVVEELIREARRLPFHIEVLAFADEEGVRFGSTLTSSKAVAGKFNADALDEADADGMTRRTALAAFGCKPDEWAGIARDPAQLIGYVEVHIEQGPVLEAEGEALGIVTAIAGCSRGTIALTGTAGHAGTLPMAMRQDALTGAAAVILMIERLGQEMEGLTATVGVLDVPGAAVNVVPGRATLSYDIRSSDDRSRVRGVAMALGRAKEIAELRGLGIDIDMRYAAPAATSDPALVAALTASVESLGGRGLALPSGAGHDAMAFRGVCPQAMLFVRCREGISHNPAEFCAPEDIELAARALHATVLTLAETAS